MAKVHHHPHNGVGIKAEKSRFAALKIEGDDDDDNERDESGTEQKKATAASSTKRAAKPKSSQSKLKAQLKAKNNVAQTSVGKYFKDVFEEVPFEELLTKCATTSPEIFGDEQKMDELYRQHLELAMQHSADLFQEELEKKVAKTKKIQKTNGLPLTNGKKHDFEPVKVNGDSHEMYGVEKSDEGLKYVKNQYKDEIEKKETEINTLKEALEALKLETIEVRTRNKQLAFIIAHGEMKEKSELLLQIEELTNVKNDLSDQIGVLHMALEQEKSKVHQLENEAKKSHTSKNAKQKTQESHE